MDLLRVHPGHVQTVVPGSLAAASAGGPIASVVIILVKRPPLTSWHAVHIACPVFAMPNTARGAITKPRFAPQLNSLVLQHFTCSMRARGIGGHPHPVCLFTNANARLLCREAQFNPNLSLPLIRYHKAYLHLMLRPTSHACLRSDPPTATVVQYLVAHQCR